MGNSDSNLSDLQAGPGYTDSYNAKIRAAQYESARVEKRDTKFLRKDEESYRKKYPYDSTCYNDRYPGPHKWT